MGIECPECGSEWFETPCIHEKDEGTRCHVCKSKINIDWTQYGIIEEKHT